MSTVNLSLANLFEAAFGYRSTAFDPQFTDVVGAQDDDRNTQKVSQTGAKYWGYANGREYYMPVTVEYIGADGGKKELVLSYPIISVSARKLIIETPLTERRGTVKEIINIADYDINIRGFMISGTKEYPEADVQALRDLWETNTAVRINSVLTDLLLLGADRKGSDKVVIKEMLLPEMKGVNHVQAYQLSLVSDAPFNLIEIG